MFETIEGLVEDPKVLVCVLVDEVESLAAARSRSGNEPSDAIRVVNAVLTQLDNIRRLPNVLILTTSNITGMIDVAFVDRADLKKYIGLPCEEAAYNMLKGSIGELADKNVIQSPVTIYEYAYSSNKSDKFSHAPTDALLAVVAKCTGLSGRMLRKLPFLAIVKIRAGEEEIATLQQFLEALHAVVDEELEDRKKLI